MPFRDHVIYRYLGTKTGSGIGSTYTFELQEEEGLWAEVVQVVTIPSNLQQTYSQDVLYKVRMQTPDNAYDLDKTRFLWTWQGRTHFLQPYKQEIRSGNRSEICMYYCKAVSDFR